MYVIYNIMRMIIIIIIIVAVDIMYGGVQAATVRLIVAASDRKGFFFLFSFRSLATLSSIPRRGAEVNGPAARKKKKKEMIFRYIYIYSDAAIAVVQLKQLRHVRPVLLFSIVCTCIIYTQRRR